MRTVREAPLPAKVRMFRESFTSTTTNASSRGVKPRASSETRQEGVWKTTRKLTTHNRFYPTVEARDVALRRTFRRFQRKPALIAAHGARFRGHGYGYGYGSSPSR